MARSYALSDDSVVVVIGSGAGGGTLANELAQKGIDVVCLEAGGRLELSDIVNDEDEMSGKFLWLDRRIGEGIADPHFPAWTCKTVGGTTLHWTGVSLRMQAHEFRAGAVYGGVAGASFLDWPLTLEELEPYYARAEFQIGVTGTHGMPFLPESNNYKVMKLGARRLGYKQFNTNNLGINSTDRDGRPACRQIGFCTAGCPIGAKWSTLYSEIPKAEASGHFELRTRSMAVRVNHDGKGRVSGVVYVDGDGVWREQKARVVCVAGNAVETPRLLLNSDSALFPDGLANSSGHVGRHYMRHMAQAVFGLMPGPVNFHRGAQLAGIIRDEQVNDPGRGFVGGYNMELVQFSLPVLAERLVAGGWGQDYANLMEQYDHFAGMLIIGEDPPEASNRITLHATEKDHLGLPVPVVHYDWHQNTKAMSEHAFAAGEAVYQAAGAERTFRTGLAGSSAHNMGSCRMSGRAGDGVCNAWGQTHDIDNLFISDGSQMTTGGAENPTLTIVALVIRQAEFMAREMARGVL